MLTARAEFEHRVWTSNIPDLEFLEKPVSIRKLVSHIDKKLAELDLQEAAV